MFDAFLDPAFNGADLVCCFGLVVGLWFLIRPRRVSKQEPSDG